MSGQETKFKVGDDCHLFMPWHQGDTTPGKVVAVVNLPGWAYHHYVVETENAPLDPDLCVRDDATLWRWAICDD